MLKKIGIPGLSEANNNVSQKESPVALSADRVELLAQSLEAQMQPIIKEAIRDAIKDGARRMARDMRKRLDDEMSLMIREAIDDAIHGELQRSEANQAR